MKKSFNIWIPSLQSFIRFYELSTEQYKTILKSIPDNDIDFIFTLNSIIETNIINYEKFSKLTTIDRFVIFLALKIHSCSSEIVLSSKCEKCETVSSIKMNLNTLIDNLASRIDKSFRKTIEHGRFIVECDIPTIETDYKIHEHGALHNIEKNSIDNNLNNYILSHIKEVYIDDKSIGNNSLSYESKLAIINKLPARLIINIQDHFLKDIRALVADFDFLQIKCSGKKCDGLIDVKFDIGNINDIIKILYKDQTLESILIEIANVSNQTYLGGNYLSSISPIELHLLTDSLKKAEKEANSPPQQREETDLFDQYKNPTKGMVESPSEFGNL
jgi:hypothetical protein